MDRHDLYERCVQSPRDVVAMLRAIHGHDPRALAEDFCGTGAVSRCWARSPGFTAAGCDIDPAVIDRALALRGESTPRARFEVRDATAPRDEAPWADAVFVGNFSIGEIHDRPTLVRYMRSAHARLRARGVLVCDTYGGESAFRLGAVTRQHPGPDGSIILYTWEHRAADPATGRVENAIHFRVVHQGEVVFELADAFVYRWRLWSVPELRDAMLEAGFAGTSVHASLTGEADEPLGADYIVCVAGRRV